MGSFVYDCFYDRVVEFSNLRARWSGFDPRCYKTYFLDNYERIYGHPLPPLPPELRGRVMGWSSGAELAESIWSLVREHIPEDKRKEIALEISNLFKDYDCDTLDEAETLWKEALPDPPRPS